MTTRKRTGAPSQLCLTVATALWLALCASPLGAQYTTASLGGTVLDATGAAVPGAKITIRNVDTGLVLTATTETTGAYLFSRLPVGAYELTVEKEGFATYVQPRFTLAVNQAATQNVTLRVGQVSERVTVEAEAELVVTRTATAGQLVDQRQILELPLNARRPERLIYLAAGTVDLGRNSCVICGHGGVYPGEETAGVNGAGRGQVNFQLDATSHNDTYLNAGLPFPNPDSIQEFNLQSNNLTAEYGNASGGIVNIVTKSGTNEIHGSAFHLLRNGALNARQFFAPEQDKLKRNQFGGSLGGPVVRDRLFYFGTFQGTRVRNQAAGRISFVPTAAQRAGDFSSVSRQLVDPLTNQPVPGNQIPASRLNRVSQFFLKWIPLPNGPGNQLTFAGNPIRQTENQFMTKLDWVHGRHQIAGRYYFTDYDQPAVLPKDNVLAAASGNAVRLQNISINHNFTASAALLINSTFGFNRQRGGSLVAAPFSFRDAGVAIEGQETSSLKAPPALSVSVTDGFSISTSHLGAFDRGDFTIREVVTRIQGPHELRFGGEAVRVSNHIVNTFRMYGGFTFNGQLSGHGLSDFMFGRASQFLQGGGEFKDLKGTRWGSFVQDNWRVSQRLMLNLGLRWDPYIPYYDRPGRVVCFQPNTTQRSKRYPNAPLGFLYGGDNPDPGCPQGGSLNNWWNLAPRIGFAYRLTQDGRTSLRAGFGDYYTPIDSSETNAFSNTAPFGGSFTLNAVAFEDPYGSFGMANPFPANFGPAVPGPEFQFAPINDIRWYFAPDYRAPRLTTWNLRLERQFGKDWAMGAAYLGNKGTHRLLRPQENPAVYIPGVDSRGNPLSTVGNTQARRVYPTFGPVTRSESSGNSSYHALQLNAEKRFARGFSLLTNYTFSKSMDDISGANPITRRFERALSGEDIPHNFKLSGIYAFPRAAVSGAADRILNGWQLNAIVVWQSGFPFTVSSGRDNSFTAVGSDRADYLGGQAQFSSDRPHGEQVLRWFDTSRFAVNAVGTFGNAGRNLLRGPKYFNTDFGILKNTKVSERIRVQFRAEFFNFTNTVKFRLPNSNVSSAQIGRITAVVDDSQRTMQFGLKLSF